MSQTAQHTPEPWSSEWQFIVAPDVTGNHIDVYIAEICEEDDEGRVVGEEEQKANARLIAAAPELLIALEDQLALMETGFVDGVAYDEEMAKDVIRTIIAKATGK